jgi:hypothetical protein
MPPNWTDSPLSLHDSNVSANVGIIVPNSIFGVAMKVASSLSTAGTFDNFADFLNTSASNVTIFGTEHYDGNVVGDTTAEWTGTNISAAQVCGVAKKMVGSAAA